MLDVGTGAGDIPRALVRWARGEGRRIRVFALDRDAATLQIAAQVVRAYPEISFLRGDALALPIRPASVDLTISAMTLHHLEPDAGAAATSRRWTRAARLGMIVNDLVRSRDRPRGGVADHALHHPQRDRAPRRAAVGAALVHAARGEPRSARRRE